MLKANRNTVRQGKAMERGIAVLFYFALAMLLLITGVIFVNGIPALSFEFLFTSPRNNMSAGGIWPALFGTFAVVLLMILFVVPVGVFSAIYINEYRKENLLNKLIRESINSLAGMPSIVYGLFGLGFLVLTVGDALDSVLETGMLFGQPALLWASATLSLLVLPTIIVTTLDALRAVPSHQREAAYGLGATRWETLKTIVLPQAGSGILTGIIMAVSRAIGETAPILFLGAAFYLPNLPVADICFGEFCIPMINPFSQFMYLSYHIYVLATQSANPSATMQVQYGATLVLILITLSLNATAIWLRIRFRRSMGL